jgi:hypothetical protein
MNACTEGGIEPSMDDLVHLNEVQVLGSHNSFHIVPKEPLFTALLAFSAAFAFIDYTHIPLPEQFDTQGIRQIELDVYYDPNGGLYNIRHALTVLGMDPDSHEPAMLEPGFKVLHTQDIDFETTCLTFVACLQQVKDWSDTHPDHLPLMILVEAKDDAIPDPLMLDFVIPLPVDAQAFLELDAEIRSVFPASQLITPDDVRQGLPTLEEAVLTLGWPTLREARGKVLFGLDNEGKRDQYRNGDPTLAGRVLFTNSAPGQPDGAFVKRNDPFDDQIPELVSAGYIVRTRADADTHEARDGNTAPRESALASGAQYVSTDYPVPDPDFGTGYFVEIPDGTPGRCNPINAPIECVTADLGG